MKILITSTQWPYHGGAATNSYALIKYLRKVGHNVCGVFFNERGRPNVDPDRIGGVFAGRSTELSRFKDKAIRELGGFPDLILAKNYVAPVYSKSAFPSAKVVYLVSGAPNMIEFSKKKVSAQKYLSSDFSKLKFGKSNYNGVIHKAELNCVKKSDYYLCNSEISKKIFLKNYENYIDASKVLDPVNTSIFVNNYLSNNTNFLRREIDILYASSNLKRDVKNFQFAHKIFSYLNNTMGLGAKIVVVGSNFEHNRKSSVAKYMGVLPNKNLIKLMSNSKLVINTSYFDASPNLITEAVYNNCNILVSKNCGWSEKYDQRLVCSDVYDLKDWIGKVTYLLKNIVSVDLERSNQEADFLKILEKIV